MKSSSLKSVITTGFALPSKAIDHCAVWMRRNDCMPDFSSSSVDLDKLAMLVAALLGKRPAVGDYPVGLLLLSLRLRICWADGYWKELAPTFNDYLTLVLAGTLRPTVQWIGASWDASGLMVMQHHDGQREYLEYGHVGTGTVKITPGVGLSMMRAAMGNDDA